jgi:hypothetical protein
MKEIEIRLRFCELLPFCLGLAGNRGRLKSKWKEACLPRIPRLLGGRE